MNGHTLQSVDLTALNIESQDCIIILTDHSTYDFRRITATSKLVVDTRNATKDLHQFKDKIIKLGAGNNIASPSDYEYDAKKPPMTLVAH
jgi:UDP-N-acetyl-D-mannosaminuronate dehydrogenase